MPWKGYIGDNFRLQLKTVDASERFLSKLAGVTDPEQKRKVIGNEFVRVFEEAAVELLRGKDGREHKFLAQGTLYPDVIESVSISGNPAALIKSHHNVGGLPEDMKFELVEPLRQLFKDEVRQVGLQLGLPKEVVHRQPFPGPGLAVRILGEVTPERLRILRDADTIVVNEMKSSDWYYRVWQSFAVLLPVRSVGVMGDERTYDYTIALRIVESQDGMTADWVRLPYELLGPHLRPHQQRGQGRQPRVLRCFQQAAQHHRMGVGGHPQVVATALRCRVGFSLAQARQRSAVATTKQARATRPGSDRDARRSDGTSQLQCPRTQTTR